MRLYKDKRLMTLLAAPLPAAGVFLQQPRSSVRVLVVVEGVNDVEFLRRISRVLHADDRSVPSLGQLESAGRLMFLPIGGNDKTIWSHRLAPLGIPEFHLLDRDVPPLAEEHQRAVAAVNRRQGCIAALTHGRHLENYLHPQAIFRARGIHLQFGPEDDLAELVARQSAELVGGQNDWPRKRRQLKHRAKRWLNTDAVDGMTPELLADQDPQGDVHSWLEAIQWLIDLDQPA